MSTTTKSVRILPSWEMRVEKLLSQNREERDKTEFITVALINHVTDWLLKYPRVTLPPSILTAIYDVASLAAAERENRRLADMQRALKRLQFLMQGLLGDEKLITSLLTAAKVLIDIMPEGTPLANQFRNAFGVHATDPLLYDSLSGISLRPADATEEWTSKRPPRKGDAIDPDEFNQPFQDSHGHTATVGGRIPVRLDSVIDMIVASCIFPYDTSSDPMRHAIARHIVALETQPSPPSVQNQATALSRLLREWEVTLESETDFFVAVRETVANYTKLNDTEGVYSACINAKVSIEIMPDSLWKERRQRLFEAEFGHLLAGRGIDLNPNHS